VRGQLRADHPLRTADDGLLVAFNNHDGFSFVRHWSPLAHFFSTPGSWIESDLSKVPPTSAVRKYSGLEQDAVAAGRELQVEAVLVGKGVSGASSLYDAYRRGAGVRSGSL